MLLHQFALYKEKSAGFGGWKVAGELLKQQGKKGCITGEEEGRKPP